MKLPHEDRALLRRVGEEYFAATGCEILWTDAEGAPLFGRAALAGDECRFLIREALKWGEPSILIMSDRLAAWAMPLTVNNLPVGGAVVSGRPLYEDADESRPRTDALRAAAEQLRLLCEKHNLANAALLAAARDSAKREREQAEDIHEFKQLNFRDIRAVYLHHEPALIAAIGNNDRPEARRLLNQILIGIYSMVGNDLARLKTCLLELTVTLLHSAVEAGGDINAVLGDNQRRLQELLQTDNEEELAAWIADMLNTLMNAIEHAPQDLHGRLGRALNYLRRHADENPGRDDIARLAGLSPSHFSREVRRVTGKTYSELLHNCHLDQARLLLIKSDKTIAEIAVACGFFDQSHLAKSFQKRYGCSPRQYRQYRQNATTPKQNAPAGA